MQSSLQCEARIRGQKKKLRKEMGFKFSFECRHIWGRHFMW